MSCDTPSELYAFVAVLAMTIPRTLMIVQLIPKGNTVKMLGGPNPNGWLGPWVTDSILGLLVPVMIALSLTLKGVPLLACLFAYNILGAYDYAHGLLTQYLEPQAFFMWKPAVPSQIYFSIGFGCVCNITCAVLLLTAPVQHYFVAC
eukprot:76018-Prymnesium_polylepis.1